MQIVSGNDAGPISRLRVITTFVAFASYLVIIIDLILILELGLLHF